MQDEEGRGRISAHARCGARSFVFRGTLQCTPDEAGGMQDMYKDRKRDGAEGARVRGVRMCCRRRKTCIGYERADMRAGSLQKVLRGLHIDGKPEPILRNEGSNRWKVWKGLAISRPRAPRRKYDGKAGTDWTVLALWHASQVVPPLWRTAMCSVNGCPSHEACGTKKRWRGDAAVIRSTVRATKGFAGPRTQECAQATQSLHAQWVMRRPEIALMLACLPYATVAGVRGYPPPHWANTNMTSAIRAGGAVPEPRRRTSKVLGRSNAESNHEYTSERGLTSKLITWRG
ncbi:hypothetical protein PMIN01_02853 [Paraphaeosphaeria minitans]|uniref:Uncharacterized protein n=1 Tax=Paraphaeosphaeria minitans TaxID=565426 RepID=A0A9P6GS38_9PLEO|nr:hypothetical protein PMIN01_02853 [Paraphaeosphaeria minitans]